MPRDAGVWLACFAAFAVGWIALSAPWLTGEVTIPYDAKAHFQAQIQFLANSLASGQSPFWNPHVFGGSPQIADPQSMIFSPALLLAWLNPAPTFQAVDTMVFAMLALGGGAVILLFREKKWGPIGAVVGALGFAFGASAASRVQHVGQIFSLVFFMIALWLLVRMLRKPGVWSGVALGTASGLMIVQPDQVALLGCYCLVLVLCCEILMASDPLALLRALLAPSSAAAVAAAATAAGPILLAWLFVEESTRPAITYAHAVESSLHPASLLTAVIGDLYGAQNAAVDYWGPFSAAWQKDRWMLTQNMGQVYVGALPIILVLSLGFAGRRLAATEIRPFVIAMLFVLLYALGHHTPAFRILYEVIPGVSGFRRPADATFILGAFTAVLGGYLVHRLFVKPEDAHVMHRTAFWGGLIIAACCLLALLVALSVGRVYDAAPEIGRALAWLTAAALLARMLPILARRSPLGALGLVTLFMVADLHITNGPNESTALPPAQYASLKADTRDETVGLLKALLTRPASPDRRDRIEAIGVAFHWPNAPLVHGFENVLGYNPLRLRTYSEATGADENAAGPDQRKFSPLFPSYRSLMADLLGLRYVVSGVPIEEIDPQAQRVLPLIARTSDAYIYENTSAFPRVLFVSKWALADFDAMIETGKWPDFDPRASVLLEEAPEHDALSRDTPGATGSARIASYHNTRVEIDVVSDRPGMIVLNDVWHQWWRASVNGQPARVMRANVIFRAVETPAGRSRVVFEFDPIGGAMAQLGERLFGDE